MSSKPDYAAIQRTAETPADLLAALDQARAEWDELAKRNHELHETVDNYAGHCETACKRADTAEAVLAELRADYAVLEGIRRDLMARCERMRSLEGLSLDEIAARQIAHDASLKREGAAEWLEKLAGDADGQIRMTHEWLRAEAAKLRDGGE